MGMTHLGGYTPCRQDLDITLCPSRQTAGRTWTGEGKPSNCSRRARLWVRDIMPWRARCQGLLRSLVFQYPAGNDLWGRRQASIYRTYGGATDCPLTRFFRVWVVQRIISLCPAIRCGSSSIVYRHCIRGRRCGWRSDGDVRPRYGRFGV